MWSVQKQDFLWAEWVSSLVTELSPDGRKRGLLGLGGACETSRLFLLLPTWGSGVGRGLGLGPGAPLSLDWGENSVGSWHDGNAVGEGVEDERCSCSPIALGKGRVALQGLPAENGFASLFGLVDYCTGLQAGLPASAQLPTPGGVSLIVSPPWLSGLGPEP